MALDITGIQNVNEFYSHHYLDALLSKDIHALLSRWEDAEKSVASYVSPVKALSRCTERYLKAKAAALQTGNLRDRFDATHGLNVDLAESLGYGYASGYEFIAADKIIPVLTSLKRDGSPYLWIVEAPFFFREKDDELATLEKTLQPNQRPVDSEYLVPTDRVWADLASDIFRRDEPPRWLMLLAGSEIYLIERHKWSQGKYLLFDVDDLLGRKSPDALKATAALLARDALCPEDGTVIHDTLDENSHKHAYAVSEDLKFGIRHAVELLANEYIWYQRTVSKKALFGDDALARMLTTECLRYLYRLLFLLYVEARGDELEIVPMKSEEYRLGYSLESLRDLEQVPLTTDAARNGYFIDQTLTKLFGLVNDGYDPAQAALPYPAEAVAEELRLDIEDDGASPTPDAADDSERLTEHGLTLPGLHSPLFDRGQTPLLSSVRFRNYVLQKVIDLLSLSKEGGRSGRGGRGGRRRSRGRISYAQLGINQLGAVYEGLLSYSGFFADEDLYEVKPAGAAGAAGGDDTQQSYFVKESDLSKYNEDEFVYEDVDSDPDARRRRKYPKGAFIFRLAGRDREKTASYYTPEVLTRCVVRYALKELIGEDGDAGAMPADRILELTVCEPAMGSAAFLNEAVNQLADAYLRRKQKELGRAIPPAAYALEYQKVKAYLATHNCFGVDLNPVATELARVSLWLNTIYKGSKCPWFSLRMAVGNSLIGGRRQVFRAKDIARKASKTSANWLDLVPEAVPLGPQWTERPKDGVYHFLLPDSGMVAFDKDKAVKELAPDEIKAMVGWRKEFCKPFDKEDASKLVGLSDAVDALWKQVIRERRAAAEKTSQAIGVWGRIERGGAEQTIDLQEKIAQELERPYTAYRRLKLIMDYWCALWFWPIKDATSLPTRDEFLLDIELILTGTVTRKDDGRLPFEEYGALSEEHRQFIGAYGYVDVDDLCDKVPRLGIVRKVAEQVRFHHWELRFAEVFAGRGGFDLIVGNPPWVKIEWNEGGLLSEFEPVLALRDVSASDIAGRRKELVNNEQRVGAYLAEFVHQNGTKAVLSDTENYPLLRAVQTNLYKCFVTRAWDVGSPIGCVGLLHPEGVYDDPKGGALREEMYRRLKGHYQFVNELKLFAEIDHHNKFSVNAYRARPAGEVGFHNMANLYHPSTIDLSFRHDGEGAVPGIKNAENQWELRPHRRRLMAVNPERLQLFSEVFEAGVGSPLHTRLPALHSELLLTVLEKLARQPRRLKDLAGEYLVSEMWHETNAQKDGTIKRETKYPRDPGEMIFSGPHFYVGAPFYQTPNESCRHNLDYSGIDLTAIPDDYLPRTNYVPACSREEYNKRTPRLGEAPVTDSYRHVHRAMLSLTGERTLISAVLPPRCGNIHTSVSLVFVDTSILLSFSGLSNTLPLDFYVRLTGKGFLQESTIAALPLPLRPAGKGHFQNRTLRLNCLTRAYAALWDQFPDVTTAPDAWCKTDPRLEPWPRTAKWDMSAPLRADFSRRQALVELDALAALALDLTEEELVTIYRVQFPVLQQYERTNRYDQTGRLVPNEVLRTTASFSVDINAPLTLSAYTGPPDLVAEIKTAGLGMTAGIKWLDPKMEPRMERIYPPPFTTCDRETDMRQAYRAFQERLAVEAKAPKGSKA